MHTNSGVRAGARKSTAVDTVGIIFVAAADRTLFYCQTGRGMNKSLLQSFVPLTDVSIHLRKWSKTMVFRFVLTSDVFPFSTVFMNNFNPELITAMPGSVFSSIWHANLSVRKLEILRRVKNPEINACIVSEGTV